MAKKSLIISDKEKYGSDKSMGAMIATSGKKDMIRTIQIGL